MGALLGLGQDGLLHLLDTLLDASCHNLIDVDLL
jgi:hypothetical protein